MAESTASVIIDVISQKLDNAALWMKDKDKLLGLQYSIAKIRKLQIAAEKLLAENCKVETWQKKLEDALKATDSMNEDDLRVLDTPVSKIRNVLKDAEKKQDQSKQVTTWLKKLEDVVSEADDTMDDVYNEVHVELDDLSSDQLGKLKNIKEKLDTFGEKIKQIIEDSKERHEDQPHKVFTKELDPDFKRLWSDSWMESHVNDVKKHLLEDGNEGEKVAALAIVGYGGLGKTTLAQQVFLDWEIEEQFDLTIWLNVDYDFDISSLLKGIVMYTAKKNQEWELLRSTMKKADEKVFMSLVKGFIMSAAKKDGTAEKDSTAKRADDSEREINRQNEVELVRMKVIHEFFDGTDLKEFRDVIENAIKVHLHHCHLDEGQFRKEMTAKLKKIMDKLGDEIYKEGEKKLVTEMIKLEQELSKCEFKLTEKLREGIEGKRLLLVLDDVSNMDPEKWENFKNLLSNSNVREGSRIIITTRNKQITSKMVPHTLKNLGDDDAWTTFIEGVRSNLGEDQDSEAVHDSKSEEMRKDPKIVEMLKKCGGNPLALRKLGEKFKKFEKFISINVETLTEFQNVVTETILPSLKPSYDILPLHLKHCFAYCSIFPQQYEIDVKTLIHLWMAQGLIYPQPGQRMEDVGYEYFKNLHQRCLFEQVGDDRENVSKYKMPNLIQDLAVFVAGTRLATLKEHEKHSIDRRTRHVSFHFHVHASWKMPTSFLQAKRIQTIILPCQFQKETKRRVSHSTCESIISNCKALRTLDLHNTGIDKLPKNIGKLNYLRYLDLSQNKAIKSLPDSITTIPYLMILKLSKCYGLKKLPKNMKKLVHLKHLEIDWCYSLTRMPLGLGELTLLETLSQFALKDDAADSAKLDDELKELKKLRGELKIQNLTSDMNSGIANLEGKEHLKSLTLAWKFDENANPAPTGDLKTLEGLKPHPNLKELALFGYRTDKFPKWLISHKNLVKFSLQKCKCNNLPPLSELSSLKVLILDAMANLKYISDESECHYSSSTAFMPSLEELRLTELPKLKGWWADVSKTPTPLPSFPCLSKLLIEDCPKLHSMPLFPNLKEWLVLDNTNLKTFIQTMDNEMPSRPLSESQSLPSRSDMEIISEDGGNDKIKLERAKTMCSISSFTKTTNDASSSKSTTSDAKRPTSHPLSKLESLLIIGNKEVSSEDGHQHNKIKWERLTSLRILRFDYHPTLKNLPTGLQHVTTLEELQIWRCDIKTLPEWIKNLKSLKTLRLLTCPFLESLPSDGLGSSLNTLEIVDCPILLQRCQKNTGADWNLIKDIENRLLQQPQYSLIFKSTKESTKEKGKNQTVEHLESPRQIF
ncbi:disease resistance protein RGA2-like [Ziziphus jujuba]|uniref:Disease resistance protein RGA2-like n=1 Tax=Ziziphus jujuba TaxID=326968 RepID=A0ABM4A0G9_ZIZJJ|nr:disease resistance protein RGA2-like [Ziziphus jujuba]